MTRSALVIVAELQEVARRNEDWNNDANINKLVYELADADPLPAVVAVPEGPEAPDLLFTDDDKVWSLCWHKAGVMLVLCDDGKPVISTRHGDDGEQGFARHAREYLDAESASKRLAELLAAPVAVPEGWRPTHRHYKGGLYQEIGRGIHTETEEELVFYRNEGGTLFARPAAMFDDVLPNRIRRFTPLSAAPPVEREG